AKHTGVSNIAPCTTRCCNPAIVGQARRPEALRPCLSASLASEDKNLQNDTGEVNGITELCEMCHPFETLISLSKFLVHTECFCRNMLGTVFDQSSRSSRLAHTRAYRIIGD